MSKTHFPGANITAQYFAKKFTGAKINPNVCVLHTTETPSWPGYSGGATAPTMTVRPNFKTRTLDVRQHFPADRSARALVNLPGGVETNTAHAFQIELTGTCDDRYRVKRAGWGTAGVDYIYWPDAPDWALAELAKILRWLDAEWPDFVLQDAAPRGWFAYGKDERQPGREPASYGASKARLSMPEWRRAYGVVGHQHVPENHHGDPGRFPIARLIELARGEKTPVDQPPAPPTSGEKTYTVVKGDTLGKIAARYPGLTVDQLAAWNGILNPNRISIGQRLRLTAPPATPKPVDPPKPPPAKPAHQDVSVLLINAASRNADVIKTKGAWSRRGVAAARYVLEAQPDVVGFVELYEDEREIVDAILLPTYRLVGVKRGRVLYVRAGAAAVVGAAKWTDLLPGVGTKDAVARKLRFLATGARLNVSLAHLSYETSAAGVRKRAKEAPAWIRWTRRLFPADYDLFVGDVNAPAGATTRPDDVGPIFAAHNLRDLRHDVKGVAVGRGRYHLLRAFGGAVRGRSITTDVVGFSDHPAVHLVVRVPTA